MTISEAMSRPISEATSPSVGDAGSASETGAASSGRKGTAFLVATLLMLGCAGVLGYTQWWVPREQAQQNAKVAYEHCLKEVKVYKGKHSYKDRLAQCAKFLNA
jgi:hypothetical protein